MIPPQSPTVDSPWQKECWLIEIELKRVQQYLFSAPRLRAMVGANAVLGEVLRGHWLGGAARFAPQPRSLPWLAVQHGSGCPPVVQERLQATWKAAPDPSFALPGETESVAQDDPLAVACATGVLTRDAGHFEAAFPSLDAARCFARDAADLLREQLGEVRHDLRISKWVRRDGDYAKELEVPAAALEEHLDSAGFLPLDLPQAFACEVSGNAPSSCADVFEEEPRRTSLESFAKLRKGSAFDRGRTRDVLGILREELLDRVYQHDVPIDKRNFSNDLGQVGRSGYLAVIHADGNGVGNRMRQFQASPEVLFDGWSGRETFCQRMRAGVRGALVDAFEAAFAREWSDEENPAPVRPLMLGGDDLLLVCDAVYALRFVCCLAEKLAQHTADLPGPDGSRWPLSLGCGVAIVHANFPFSRAHELVEDLAKSAKQIGRDPKGPGMSAVDWAIISESWHDDLKSARRDLLLQDGEGVLALSAKPYPALEQQATGAETPVKSLQGLLQDAQKLVQMDREASIHSQLRGLQVSLREGRYAARFALQAARNALPGRTWRILEEGRYVLSESAGPDPWLAQGERAWTHLLDLLEVFELERMLRVRSEERPRVSAQE